MSSEVVKKTIYRAELDLSGLLVSLSIAQIKRTCCRLPLSPCSRPSPAHSCSPVPNLHPCPAYSHILCSYFHSWLLWNQETFRAPWCGHQLFGRPHCGGISRAGRLYCVCICTLVHKYIYIYIYIYIYTLKLCAEMFSDPRTLLLACRVPDPDSNPLWSVIFGSPRSGSVNIFHGLFPFGHHPDQMGTIQRPVNFQNNGKICNLFLFYFQVTLSGCPVLDAWHGWPVTSFLSGLPCLGCHVPAVLSWLYCPGTPLLVEPLPALPWRPSCLSILSWWSFPGCPVPLVLSGLFCPGCYSPDVFTFRSVLSLISNLGWPCPGCPFFSFLVLLGSLSCGCPFYCFVWLIQQFNIFYSTFANLPKLFSKT